MNKTRAAEITHIREGKGFYLRIKLVRENYNGSWSVCDKGESVLTEQRKSRSMVILTNETPSGTLVVIDRPNYDQAYSVAAVVYG